MSTTYVPAEINSQPWWEEYFAKQWDENNGRKQTANFMQRLIESLPDREREFLSSKKSTILDWGCAFGNGVDALSRAFPNCHVVGTDFAQRAIDEARRCFPNLEFFHTQDKRISDRYDVIVTSNCLEHFADPLSVVRQHLKCCRRFYLVMVPYREAPLHPQHISQFREECFPDEIEGFSRIAFKVIRCDLPYWDGLQVLVVYGSRTYRSMRALRNIAFWCIGEKCTRRRRLTMMGWQALHGDLRPFLSAVQRRLKKAVAWFAAR